MARRLPLGNGQNTPKRLRMATILLLKVIHIMLLSGFCRPILINCAVLMVFSTNALKYIDELTDCCMCLLVLESC